MGKTQHYVPQFYLRQFSEYIGKKEIDVFNIARSEFFRRVPIKGQACRPHFYGKDDKIEQALSILEAKFASLCKDILTGKLCNLEDEDKFFIHFFIMISYLRTGKQVDDVDTSTEKMLKCFAYHTVNDKYKRDNIDKINISLANPAEFSLSSIDKSYEMIWDLETKIIINRTNRSFITSNAPVCVYNSYLEYRKYIYSSRGLALNGTIFVFPISKDIAIYLYDSDVYEYVSKNNEIRDRRFVDNLNKLQILHADNIIFYSSPYSEKWILKYVNELKSFIGKEKSSINFGFLSYETEGRRVYRIVDNFKELPASKGLVIAQMENNIYAGIAIPLLRIKECYRKILPRNYPVRDYCARLNEQWKAESCE